VDKQGAVILSCPECGGGYLHHEDLSISIRDIEDGPATRAVFCNKKLTVSRINDAPGRRDSLRVFMRCEDCGGGGSLEILQHKGQTVFRWT
jgi:hypothetical protein